MRVLAAALTLITLAVGVDAMQQRSPAPPRDAVVPFQAGETITYDVSWSNLLTAATAVTKVVQKRPSFGSTAWEITADGRPLPLIQRLYPVYYKMDTLLDSVSLLSQWTGLYLDENGRKRQTSMRFDRTTRKIQYELTTAPTARAELNAPTGIQDGLALLYALRTRPFRAGDRFTIPVADDGSLYSVAFATSGPEKVSTRLGMLDAWKVNVTIVNEAKEPVGNDIVVWFTTDARHFPAKIQAQLPVGKFILTVREVQ